MQQWEYLVVSGPGILSFKKFDEVAFLNEKGKDGWELIQAPTYGTRDYYFKRPKK